MRTSFKGRHGLGACAVAGVVALAGHSAFTDSNTVAANIAGYGSHSATGAVVTDVNYTTTGFGESKVSAITFKTSTDFSGYDATNHPLTAVVTIYLGSAPTVEVGKYSCTVGYTTNSTITCDLSASVTPLTGVVTPLITSFDNTALSVVS